MTEKAPPGASWDVSLPPDVLLAHKLFIPQVHTEFLPRPRLTKRLDAGLKRKLTLISAPPGFGKTTLLSAWAIQSKTPVGWVALDDNDNDLVRFLTYLVAGIRRVFEDIGGVTLNLLHAPQPPPMESVLTPLINEIASSSGDFALILDDYHVIDTEPIHEALTLLLDNLPPQMHLIIATRREPPLPLARMRARGDNDSVTSSIPTGRRFEDGCKGEVAL